MTTTRPKVFSSAAVFLSDLAWYRPRMLAGVFLLMLARSLSEGVTFILLVPLLGLAGAVPADEAGAQLPPGLSGLQAVLPAHPSIELTLALFLGVMLLRAALGYASTVVSSTFQAGFIDHVRQRVYLALSRASWLHLAGARQAHDTHALTTQTGSVGTATWYVVNLAAGSLTILTGLAVALALSPRLTLAVIVASVMLALPMAVFQRWAYERGTAALQAMQALYDVLTARMNGLKLAKAFAIEKDLEADFAVSSAAHRRAVIAAQENSARASLLQEAAAAVLLAVLVYAALGLMKVSSIELVLFIMIFARLAPLAHGVQTNLRSLAGILPDYMALREREASARAAEEPLLAAVAPIALRHSLALSRVSFSYPSSTGMPVLQDISITLAARSAIGLIGLSGAGKSTLTDILAGLTPPDDGEVLIDGVPLDAGSRPHWRASVAYVPQDAPLFHDTLRENLRIGARQTSDAEIWASLEIVQAAELVRRLPGGLETMAGDRGVRLSGGERQRIRLASALLRRPQLLILDESTSALNPTDEERIIAALQSLRGVMTILLIAHRTSSIGWTDRVLFMQNGRIAADGPPAEIFGSRCSLPATQPGHPADTRAGEGKQDADR